MERNLKGIYIYIYNCAIHQKLTHHSESELFVVSVHCFLTPPIEAELASTTKKKKKEKRKRKLTMTFDKANGFHPPFTHYFGLNPHVTFKLL